MLTGPEHAGETLVGQRRVSAREADGVAARTLLIVIERNPVAITPPPKGLRHQPWM
jgi:hypothetical protein